MPSGNKAFDKVMEEAQKFRNESIDSRIAKTILYEDSCDHLETVMNDLKQEVDKLKKMQKEKFIKENMSKLLFLRDVFGSCDQNMFCDIYSIKLKRKLKKIYNNVMVPLEFNKIVQEKTKIITNIFTNFVKGITYFEFDHQVLRNPIYHRNASCGSTQQQSEYKFLRTLHGPDKSQYAKRCYIERKIYDLIYKRYFDYQDLGHLHEMKVVEQFYQYYFPKENIDIDIEFDLIHSLYPVSLTIYTKHHREMYMKILNSDLTYSNNVLCIKETYKNKKTYTKTQTFEKQSEWEDR